MSKSPPDRRQFLATLAVSAAAASCKSGPAPAQATPPPAPDVAGGTSGNGPALVDAAATTAAGDASAATAEGITADTVAAAERLVGVVYTPAERDQAVASIEAQLDWVRARRERPIALSVAPACSFDPVLPGRSPARPGNRPGLTRVRTSRVAPTPLPSSDDDIAFASVIQLAGWIRRRKLTSARLTEIYLERLGRIGPALECVVTLTADLARSQAREADREIARGRYRGPLHGIPYAAKDLFDTRNIATTFGAAPYRDRVTTGDAVVVERLAAAGAVLVAKTTLGALAYGDIWFGGKTRNPWNRREGSSGSSAGSAAATAAGLVGFSLGTETLGSIVSPSLRCGTTGLRPTFGRVARTGAMPLVWSMDKIGPIGRTVEDTMAVLAVIHGADSGDPASRTEPLTFNARSPASSLRGKKVGYDPAWLKSETVNDVDRAVLGAMTRLGLEPVELTLPDLPYASLLPILIAESAAAFEDLTLDNKDDQMTWQDKDAWPNTFRAARFLSAIDLIQADRLRRQVMEAMATIFDRVDLLWSPSGVGPLLTITNYTGHPSLTLRAGFVERDPIDWPKSGADLGPAFTAPHGTTLYGRLFDEGTLCRVGQALERELAVWDRRPPV